jgi:hypothetical protein
MDGWRAGSVLAQAFDVLRWAWALGAVLLGVASLTLGRAILRQRARPPARVGLSLLALLSPLAMAGIAGASGGAATAARAAGTGWTTYAVAALLLLHAALATASVWRAGAWRPCVAALHGLLIWPALCTALVVASMS